ncbi:MAG: hypothetical protein AAF449_13355, partial [Myxococcota bacterium]
MGVQNVRHVDIVASNLRLFIKGALGMTAGQAFGSAIIFVGIAAATIVYLNCWVTMLFRAPTWRSYFSHAY